METQINLFSPEVTLPLGLPSGFVVRPGQLNDLDRAMTLFIETAQHAWGYREFEAEDLQAEWEDPHFSLTDSTRAVFAPNGSMVGWVEVWDVRQPAINPWIWGRTHPNYEGMGIGSALMQWAEARLQSRFHLLPESTRVTANTGSPSGYAPYSRLMQRMGYTCARHSFQMLINLHENLPNPQWDAGIRVETYRHPEQAAAVYRAVRDSFRDHYGFVPEEFETGFPLWQQHWFGNPKFDSNLWFLAIDGDEIVGISLCVTQAGDDPEAGYVSTLGVRRDWRRRGIGLSLLHHTFLAFQARGQKRVRLHVDASSLTGATRLYERAGMHISRQYDQYEKVLREGQDLATRALE